MTRRRMFVWLLPLAAIGALLCEVYAVLAAPPPAESNDAIVLGMKVDTARDILDKHKITKTQLEYSLSKDTDWLFRQLSREVDVVFAYSKTGRAITEITLLYRYPPYYKVDYVSVSARRIQFEKDGSYVVHYENPKKPQGTRTLVMGAMPPFRTNGSTPPNRQESPPMIYPPPTPP